MQELKGLSKFAQRSEWLYLIAMQVWSIVMFVWGVRSIAESTTDSPIWFAIGLAAHCIFVSFWAFLIVRKRRITNEHRTTEEDDIRGADIGPPYLTIATTDTHPPAARFDPLSSLFPHQRTILGALGGTPAGTREGEGRSASVEPLIPDSVTPFVGYRYWLVHDFFDSPHLRAATRDYVWTRGINVGECGVGESLGFAVTPHYVADENCWCGFYAHNDLKDVISDAHLHLDVVQVGRVEMFGLVQEHEHGYRASHARITGIYDKDKMSKKIAERYEVPLLESPLINPKGIPWSKRRLMLKKWTS